MIGIARMQERKKKQAKRRRIIKNSMCISLVIFLCLLVIGMTKGKDKEKFITGYEYKSTDTLWGLLEYCPPDMDRWEYIELIKEINNMEDDTVYKDRLYQIPIFE